MLETQVTSHTSLPGPDQSLKALCDKAVAILTMPIQAQIKREKNVTSDQKDSPFSSQDLKKLRQTATRLCNVYRHCDDVSSFSLDDMKNFLVAIPMLDKMAPHIDFMMHLEKLMPELYYQANREIGFDHFSAKVNHSDRTITDDHYAQLEESSDQEKVKADITPPSQVLPIFYGPLSRGDQQLIALRDKAIGKLRARVEHIKRLQDNEDLSCQAVKKLEETIIKLHTMCNFNVMACFLSVAPIIERIAPSLRFTKKMRKLTSKESYSAYFKATEVEISKNFIHTMRPGAHNRSALIDKAVNASRRKIRTVATTRSCEGTRGAQQQTLDPSESNFSCVTRENFRGTMAEIFREQRDSLDKLDKQQKQATKQEITSMPMQENNYRLASSALFYGPLLNTDQQFINLRDEMIEVLSIERANLIHANEKAVSQRVEQLSQADNLDALIEALNTELKRANFTHTNEDDISKHIKELDRAIFFLGRFDCRYRTFCRFDREELDSFLKIVSIVDSALPGLHFKGRTRQIIFNDCLNGLRHRERNFYNQGNLTASQAMADLIKMLEIKNSRYILDAEINKEALAEQALFYSSHMVQFFRAHQSVKEIANDGYLMKTIEWLAPLLCYQAHIEEALDSLFMKAVDLSNRGYNETAQVIRNLKRELEDSCHTYFILQSIDHKTFKANCLELINKNRVILDTHRGVKGILDEAIRVICTIITMGCLTYSPATPFFDKCRQRRYCFFRTESGKQLEHLEQYINSKSFNSKVRVS